MNNLAYEERYSSEDYRRWEGDWELIYGRAYAMSPSPLVSHQFVNLKISRQLDEALDSCGECYAFIETDVELADDPVVRPDSMVACYQPKERLDRTPDIIFEVISTSTAKRDEILKFDLYQSEEVQYYIIVYPDNMKAKVYQLTEHRYRKIGVFSDERYLFEIQKCQIDFDFGFIWRR